MIRKSLLRLVVALGLVSLLSACAVNPMVQLKPEFWTQTDRTVVVAIATLPDTAAHKVGAQGLLDLAINNAMADDLSTALKTITLHNSYGQARSEVVRRLQEKGIKSSFTETMINAGTLKDFSSDDKSRSYAPKDFRPLKADLGGADRLLLFTVTQVGTQRSYYGFIPTSGPTAILRATGEMIDLQTNEVLWREQTANTAVIADPWDQPPEFKNVNTAVQQVIEAARKTMVEKLFSASTVAAK